MDYDFNPKKDKLLKKIRGIGFEEIIAAISANGFIEDIEHFNRIKYPNQRVLIVRIRNYIYAVPYVWKEKRKVKFLKTIYATRKLKKKYEAKIQQTIRHIRRRA